MWNVLQKMDRISGMGNFGVKEMDIYEGFLLQVDVSFEAERYGEQILVS